MLDPKFQLELVELLEKYVDANINPFLLSEQMTKSLISTLDYTNDLVKDKFE